MRIYPDRRGRIVYAFIILLVFTACLHSSCSSRKTKLEHDNLIPRDELVEIIKEVYIADGLLTLPKVRYWYKTMDSLDIHIQIIEKHGYTKEAMDQTMQYYFIKKPKILVDIYDEILGQLSEMESIYEKESLLEQSRVDNLWPKENIMFFPDEYGSDSSMINIPLNRPGLYTLTFTATLFPDDPSVNPRTYLFTSLDGARYVSTGDLLEAVSFIKDGQPHTYSIGINVQMNTPLFLKGFLYFSDNFDESNTGNAYIRKIILVHSTALV